MHDRADSKATPGHPATAEMARRIRERRRDLGLTQAELARLAGCSVRFLHALESGKPGVRLDKTLDVLQAVGLEIELRLRRV